MPEAPERIWARRLNSTSRTGIWVSGPPPADAGISTTPYVLASVADRDRRKLGVALSAMKTVLAAHEAKAFKLADDPLILPDTDNYGGPMFTITRYPDGDTVLNRLRAAIAEIEGEEG